jgi:hypothetical protein
VDVEALRLETGEAVGDGLEALAHCIKVVEAFAQVEIPQVVGTEFETQETGEFLVLAQECVLPIHAEDVMTVLDLLEDGCELAAQSFVQPHAEDLADAVGGQTPESDLAAALEDFVDREVALEDEVATVFDLGDGVEAREIHLAALAFGELRSEDEGPVVELFADGRRAQPIGGGLQGGDIIHGEEGVVVLVESDPFAVQFLFEERVSVEPVGRMEGKESLVGGICG